MLETVITIYYTIPVILAELLVCFLLWRQTKDGRTWGLFSLGCSLSIVTRYTIIEPFGIPLWVDDLLRAASITINTLGFFSLYFLLKKLIEDKKKGLGSS